MPIDSSLSDAATQGPALAGDGDASTTAMDAGGGLDAAAPDADVDEPFSVRPWPTDDVVLEVDATGAFGTDVSGLSYEPNGAGPGVLWASMNLTPAKLYRLERSGATWQRTTSDNWGDGKSLRFPDGVGIPDAEGVAKADWSSPIVYIGSERDQQGGSLTSRPGVLSYDTSAAGTTLTAQREWNLTASLPAVGGNQGIEALAFIPDAALTAAGFIDATTSAAYDPAAYATHGTGLFVVGLETQSELFFFALGSDGAIALIAKAETDLSGVMSLEYDREVGYLWAYCDDSCGNRALILKLSDGRFEKRAELIRPASLPDINNEGIAIAPESECTAGKKPFFWVEDGNTNGHVLRRGTVPCGPFL
jgi:hypothetical protein